MWNKIQSLFLKFQGTQGYLPGLWERQEDMFAGCVIAVKITEPPSTMSGQITVCPSAMRDVGWVRSDRKWISIHEKEANQYLLEDLHKEYDRTKQLVTQRYYTPAKLFFIRTDTIVLESESTYQIYRRVAVFKGDEALG